MNRRDFLKRLGLGVAGISLSPVLDLAEIIEAPNPIQSEEYLFYVRILFNVMVNTPRSLGVITNIGE